MSSLRNSPIAEVHEIKLDSRIGFAPAGPIVSSLCSNHHNPHAGEMMSSLRNSPIAEVYEIKLDSRNEFAPAGPIVSSLCSKHHNPIYP